MPKKTKSSQKLEDKVINNLIELQKIHTNLAEKFDKLAEQISQLLQLFELSARAFAKQTNIQGVEKDKEFLDKIDRLLEQNKTIAKGLVLMEEKLRERIFGPSQQQAPPMQPSMPQRQFEPPRPLPRI